MIFSKTIVFCRKVNLITNKTFDSSDTANIKRCEHTANIEIRGSIRVRPIVMREIVTLRLDSVIPRQYTTVIHQC